MGYLRQLWVVSTRIKLHTLVFQWYGMSGCNFKNIFILMFIVVVLKVLLVVMGFDNLPNKPFLFFLLFWQRTGGKATFEWLITR